MEDRKETQPFSSTLGEYSLHAGNFQAACGVGGKRWVARMCRGQHHSPASPVGSAAAAFCLLGLSFPALTSQSSGSEMGRKHLKPGHLAVTT